MIKEQPVPSLTAMICVVFSIVCRLYSLMLMNNHTLWYMSRRCCYGKIRVYILRLSVCLFPLVYLCGGLASIGWFFLSVVVYQHDVYSGGINPVLLTPKLHILPRTKEDVHDVHTFLFFFYWTHSPTDISYINICKTKKRKKIKTFCFEVNKAVLSSLSLSLSLLWTGPKRRRT